MPTTETAPPQTNADIIREAKREDREMRVFVLYHGKRIEDPKPEDEPYEKPTNIVSAGRSYGEMWTRAEAVLSEPRKDLIKKGYVFDVMTASEAAKLVG